jgi:hypothetical protein
MAQDATYVVEQLIPETLNAAQAALGACGKQGFQGHSPPKLGHHVAIFIWLNNWH